jgi:Domain of unknown function (DUF4226)
MSGWETVTDVLEDIFEHAGMPTLAPGLHRMAHWFDGGHPPAAPAPHQPPPGPPPAGVQSADGGAAATPPAAPPAPGPDGSPAAPPQGAGQAAAASAAEASQVGASVEQLAELDKQAAAALGEIQASGQAGRKALDDIHKDVDAKITELGPRLNTPQGQQELREFLKDKLTAAKQILDKHISDAEDHARKTHELTQQYAGVGGGNDQGNGNDNGGNSNSGSGSGNSGSGSSGGGTTSDPPAGGNAATTPAAAPAGAPATGVPTGMTPGGFGGFPFPGFGGGMPGFGGGSGMPGFGGGDPLGLGGLGGPHSQQAGFHDDDGLGGHSGDKPDKLDQLHDQHDGHGGETVDQKGDQKGGAGSAGTQPAGNAGTTDDHSPDNTGGGTGGSDQAAHVSGTDVKLPDGTVAQARTDQGATAARAALGGANVADAYHQAGIEIPPAGTPVTDPVPPTQLKAGDVGVWKDHLVMALGDGKVLVSGQVQPQDSLTSGPDFLGWIDPTAKAKTPPAQS